MSTAIWTMQYKIKYNESELQLNFKFKNINYKN